MAGKTKNPMDAVLANIEKQMGNKAKPVLARFGDIEVDNIPVIPFGLKDIDAASYCGGVPRGRMIEIYGPESSGKSLLTLYLIASAQRQGLECALLDIEQSFDPIWAASKGVDVKKLIYSNTFESGEQALEYAHLLCKSGALGVVVIDSTAALIPAAELEGSLEDNARIGAQAQLLSRGCRKIVAACGAGNTTCVFINQVRMKIGVMYGNPETTPGGNALKFYCHQRIRTSKKEKIKVKEAGEDVIVGQISEATFVKNKVARPFGRATFKIIFDAAALNPVVMLCNAAKTAKLIKTYNQLFNIPKDVLNSKKIETGAASILELADYLIDNNLVLPLLDKVIEAYDDDKELGELDGAILEMKEDPTKIISPKSASVSTDKAVDATEEELGDEAKDESNPEEI